MTHYALVELAGDRVSAGRLRGFIQPEGPLVWVAFDRDGSKAVVAFFHWEELFPAVQEAIETCATVLHTVEVDYSQGMPNLGRLLPGRGDMHDALIFVRCTSDSYVGLYEGLAASTVEVGTAESGGLALIQIRTFDEAHLEESLEMIPGGYPVVDGITVDEVFWGIEGGERGWT